MPSRFLRWISFSGLENHVFEDLRRAGDHPFDNPAYADATILIGERNFGCGSSREHAPQALRRWGIRAIVAESFGEIFAANGAAIGMVCVTVDRADRERLSALCSELPGATVTVDLRQRQIEAAGAAYPCVLSEGRRQQFLNGSWDSLSLLLARPDAVDAIAARAPVFPSNGLMGGNNGATSDECN